MREPHFTKTARADRCLGLVTIMLLVGCLGSILADPGPISFALGGLQFRKEPQISMVKENLTVSTTEGNELGAQITVDYDFLNNTSRDVSIAMAFPVPDGPCNAANSPYMVFTEDGSGNPRTPFHVWVGGSETQYSTEVKAFHSRTYLTEFSENLGKEYSGLLRDAGADVDHCDVDPDLPQTEKSNLANLGLLDPETFGANWIVRRKYYWTQVFPASDTTHIKIVYPPGYGHTEFYLGKSWDSRVIRATDPLRKRELRDTCVGASLQSKLETEMSLPDKSLYFDWIDFILVTANYWSGPIKDFTLTVDTPFPDKHVSFCWDEPIKHPKATRVVATAHDFSPKRNLHIGFFQVL